LGEIAVHAFPKFSRELGTLGQAFDVEPVTSVGGHAAGGDMGPGDITVIRELGHGIADRGRAYLLTEAAGYLVRRYRSSGLKVLAN
jgi:hypothetical protein